MLDGSLRTGCARVHSATRIVFDEVFFTGYRTTGLTLGFGRIVVSDIEVPNMFVNLV